MHHAPRDATALPARDEQQPPRGAICPTRTRCTTCARCLTDAPRAAAPIKVCCTEGGAICSTISSADDLGDMLTNKESRTEGSAISSGGRVVSWTPAAIWTTWATWAARSAAAPRRPILHDTDRRQRDQRRGEHAARSAPATEPPGRRARPGRRRGQKTGPVETKPQELPGELEGSPLFIGLYSAPARRSAQADRAAHRQQAAL